MTGALQPPPSCTTCAYFIYVEPVSAGDWDDARCGKDRREFPIFGQWSFFQDCILAARSCPDYTPATEGRL